MKRKLMEMVTRSLALVLSLCVVSGAWATDNVWEGDGDCYWNNADNWSNYAAGDYWVINANATSKTVKFGQNTSALPYPLAIATEGVEFVADDASYGLRQTASDIRLGAWANGSLTVKSGTHNINELAVASAWWDNTGAISGTLTIEGGKVSVATTTWVGSGKEANAKGTKGTVVVSGGELELLGNATFGCVANAEGVVTITDNGRVTANNIVKGDGVGTVTLSGGTIAATSISGVSFVINGGTFDNADAATVSSAVTGSGTLTKTGAGTLTFTGDMSGFVGKIAVAAGAGSVMVGDLVIVAGEEKQLGVYTWTGAGTPPVEEGGSPTDTDLWSNVNNWLVNGFVPKTAPAADSTVVIPEGNGTELTIKCGTSDYSGALTINRNVTIVRVDTGVENQGLRITSVSSDNGKRIKFSGGTRGTPIWRDFVCFWGASEPKTINCDLEVEGWVALHDQNSIVLKGALTGSGKIRCGSGLSANYTEYPNSVNPGNGQYGIDFRGDVSNFSGSYVGGLRNHGNRDGTRFNVELEGEKAEWTFGYEDSKNPKSPFQLGNGKTFKFGCLTTIVDGNNLLNMNRLQTSKGPTYNQDCVLKVGFKGNSISNVGGSLGDSSNKIVKVGDTSTLNLTLTEAKGAVEAEAGTLNLKGAVAPESLTITGAGATVTVENGNTAVPSLGADLATGYQLVTVTGEDAKIYTVAAKCTITWKVDGLDDEVVPSYVGAGVSHANAVRTGYVFDRWDPAVVSPATGNATYTAIWKAADVAVAQPVVAYGADYTNATVTADVTVTTPGDVTYELTVTKGVTSKKYTGGTVANGKVTFENVEIPRAANDIYADITYTVTPKSGSTALTPAATTEAPMTKSTTWGFESKVDNSEVSSTGGSWGGTTPAVKDDKLSFTDGGTFTANSASSDDIVVITMDDICFGDVNAEDLEGDAQAGVRIGQSGAGYTFQVYTDNKTWLDAAGSVTVDPEKTYDVVVTINYSTGKYSVAVDGNLLTAGSSTSFALAGTPEWTPKSVSAIEFCGEGSLASIAGEAFDGNMVVDENGKKFATIDAAIAALKAGTATAPLRLLHDGTAPQGWTIDENGVLAQASVVVESTDKVTLVAVPEECTADELINLSNRSTGDMLQVNNANGTYWSWELDTGDTGLYWKKVARVGAEPDDTPEASACTLKAGEAVWVTRKDVTKPIILNATYAAAEAKVEVAVTTGWTLVAPPPKAEAFDLDTLSVKGGGSFSDGDMIVIPGADAPINCVRKDDKWMVYTTTVVEDLNAPAGWGPIATAASWGDAPKVPAGKGFFFVSESEKTLEL